MLDKKGFLFTVTVFLVLTYILLSISVWVKAIESSERAFSEFYKESTVELTIEQITPDKMDETAYMIMSRNLDRVNRRTESFAVRAGPPDDENNYTRPLLLDLLANGSASSDYFEDGAPPMEEENSSMKAWVTDLNASLRSIGIYVSEFAISNFTIGQSNVDKVNYSFNITLQLRDFANTTSVSRIYDIRDNISIIGLVDPAMARASSASAGDEHTAYRQFFFNEDYDETSEISVSKMSQTVKSGQGWLYGPMVMALGSDGEEVPEWSEIPPITGNRNEYILVGTFDEINNLGDEVYSQFGGYIVTTPAITEDSACDGKKDESNTFNPVSYTDECELVMDSTDGLVTSLPFMVAPGFTPSEQAPVCPLLDNSTKNRRCALMVSAYAESEVGDNWSKKNELTSGNGLYEVEKMRTFVMCGYYTHNPGAPSYLQRLLPDPYLRNDTNYGIETFVIGNYVNDYGIYDTRSRLDRELFNETLGSGIPIRGLPGCKSFGACSDEPVTGVFAVGEGAKDDYGLDNIACDNPDTARCDIE